MKKMILMGLSGLTVIACQPTGMQIGNSDVQETSAEFAAPVPQAMRKDAAEDGASSHNTYPTESFLAYRYGYGLVMPYKSVKSTADKHIQICRDAGPSKCQIMGSNTNSYSDEDIRANLSLRADPTWLQSFIAGIKVDIADINGRIENENTSVEDLTRAILDTDARLKAKKTLRTRLEGLLETRDAKLADLLTLERELARVQSEIESATANLKALRARVSMSVLNINYSSERAAISRSSVSPIGDALKDFVGILSASLAAFIRILAAILPWMLLLIPGFFMGRKVWRRRKKIKFQTKTQIDK